MTGEYVKNKLKNSGYVLDDVARGLNITPQNLQSKLRSSDIKVGVLEDIAKAINKNVYFFFEDNPQQKGIEVNEAAKIYQLKTDAVVNGNQKIPLYDIEAVAGLVPLFKDAKETEAIDHISIPRLPKCDGAIYVTGDSMYPLLKSGDIIMYKQIHDIGNDIFWGEMYLLSIDTDDEEYISVKYIQKSEKGEEYVKLVSQNKHHQDRDILRSRIKALALVKASVRINSMS